MISRAFSNASIGPTKRAAPKAFGAPVSASRLSNISRNGMADVLKPKASREKERQFACSFRCSYQTLPRLSHKRNSKDFDRLKSDAAVSLHDETSPAQRQTSWAAPRARPRVCGGDGVRTDDDQRRRRNLSISDLLKMVRRVREGRSIGAI